ncbi:hypothetical protein FXO37_32142 [Capsicum annuum]|nr:hypothetical protein FXO37_32142 [Capsicum annuum]
MGTLNIINSNEFKSLMNHVFKNLPFYPTSPYLTEAETLNFILWDSLEQPNTLANTPIPQGSLDPRKAPKSVIEDLRHSNMELEQILAEIEELDVTSFTLHKPLRREFSELSNLLIVLTCSLETKILS